MGGWAAAVMAPCSACPPENRLVGCGWSVGGWVACSPLLSARAACVPCEGRARRPRHVIIARGHIPSPPPGAPRPGSGVRRIKTETKQKARESKRLLLTPNLSAPTHPPPLPPSPMARLALSALAAAALAASASAWTPEVVTTANLGGEVTSMSVMNDVIPGKTSVGLPIKSPEGCLRACADFRNGKGCNTINFCGKAEGCGSGCSQSGLGPFGNLKCTEDGKFPYMVRAYAPSLFFLLFFFLGGVACGRVHCAGRGRWRVSALASSRHTTRSSLQRACPNWHRRGGSGAGRHAHKKKERKKGIGPCGPDNSPRQSKRRPPPGGSGGRALRGSTSLPMMWMPVARHPGENPIEKARPCVRGRGGSRPSGPIPGGRGARARALERKPLSPRSSAALSFSPSLPDVLPQVERRHQQPHHLRGGLRRLAGRDDRQRLPAPGVLKKKIGDRPHRPHRP